MNELEKWFWQTTYASYFSIYSLSKQRKAFSKFQKFCKGQVPEALYKASASEVFEAVEFPSKMNYGSVRSKALGLFMIKSVIENIMLDDFEFEGFHSFFKTDKDFTLLFPIFKVTDYQPKLKNLTGRRKIKDYSFILDGDVLSFDYEANFVDDSILENKHNIKSVKESRYYLISEKERDFVESLDINYNGTDRYDDRKQVYLL